MSSRPPYRFRAAEREDVPAIISLVKRLAEYEKLAHQMVATEAEFLKYGFGDKSYYQALLAENDTGAAVGFSLYFFKFSTFLGKPTLHLEDLFVLPECRGEGIGKSFLQQLAAIALENECGRMEWDVLDWNEPAIKFYKSIHASPLGDWKTYRLTGDNLKNLADD